MSDGANLFRYKTQRFLAVIGRADHIVELMRLVADVATARRRQPMLIHRMGSEPASWFEQGDKS